MTHPGHHSDATGDHPDRIVINLEDLEEPFPTAPTGSTAGVTQQLPVSPTPSGGFGVPPARPPQLGPQPTPVPVNIDQSSYGYSASPSYGGSQHFAANGRRSFGSVIGSNAVVTGLAAGTVGGLIGALVSDPINHISWNITSTVEEQAIVGLWLLIYTAFLGFMLKAWDGFTSGSAAKGFKDGALGALIGVIAGFVGGFVAQWVYWNIVYANALSFSEPKAILARTVGWGIFGLLIGFGVCVGSSGKRIINGTVGGLLGGAVGGLLFQVITEAEPNSQTAIRIFCMVLTGTGIGVGVGLVEQVRKDSWLYVVSGPMTGKQFILYKQRTTIGRDYRCDIVLTKDLSVAPLHASLQLDQSGRAFIQAEPGATVGVNGALSAWTGLNSGDQITIGSTSILLEQRLPAASGPQMGEPRYQ
jgi:Inner membrane component of T3SS, cytoplasmic domain